MDTIRDYVRTALNGVRQRFNKLEKDLDKKLDDKLGRDELPPPQPQIQSDWNESNEESVAYICNRPFYDDIVVKTYTYENVRQSGQTSLTIDADFEGNFILGETYTVTVNGTVTDIVATTDRMGNPALIYNSDYYQHIYVSSGRLYAFTWWNNGSTVSITGPIHILKQIDNKFLNVVSSLNGETGDVVINADKLGAASSMSNKYRIDGRHTALGESFTGVTRNWLGLGSDSLTGLVLGNVIAYDSIENGLPVARFTFISDLEEDTHYDNEDVVIRGVADPTALNDATSKSYVDKAINNIGKGFASVEYVDKKLNDVIPVPATATVGQTIAVKSVDENGKPTAWEPMHFISENYGGNGAYYEQPDAPEDAPVGSLWYDTDEEPPESSGGISITGAKVGQTVKIASVDEKGKPTEWETVDFPGEDKYELIETIVCDGTYGNISRTKLSLKKVKLVINMKAASAAISVGVEAYNSAGIFGYAWIGNCINTGERFSTAWFVSDGMNAYTEYVLPGAAKYNSGAVNKTAYPQNADTPIDRLGIYTSPNSNVFPAESTIEIWGVRA